MSRRTATLPGSCAAASLSPPTRATSPACTSESSAWPPPTPAGAAATAGASHDHEGFASDRALRQRATKLATTHPATRPPAWASNGQPSYDQPARPASHQASGQPDQAPGRAGNPHGRTPAAHNEEPHPHSRRPTPPLPAQAGATHGPGPPARSQAQPAAPSGHSLSRSGGWALSRSQPAFTVIVQSHSLLTDR